MRWERPNPVLLTYTNTGAVDLRLPLLTVAADAGGELHLLPDRADADDDITLIPPPVLPGRPVVPAGASRTLTLWYTPPLTDEEITFSVWATPFEDPDLADRSLEWDADAADPPTGVDPAVWEEFIDGERARYGETWGALSDYISGRYEALGSAGLTGAVFVDGQWLFYPGNGSRPGTFRTDRPVGELAAFHTDLDTAFTAGLNPTYDAGTPPAPSQGRPRQIGGGDGIQNVYAVIVGNPDGTLVGASQDARRMASTLTDTYNVPSANVTLLTDNVSRTEGLGAVSAAVNNPEMDGDDLLFVMNSSHGLAFRSGAGDRGTRAYNGFAGKTDVTSDDWEAALDGVQTPTLFLNDSCYSSEITFDIDVPNVATLASSEWGVTVDDDSYTRQFNQLLLQNPDADWINQTAQQAADAKFNLGESNFHAATGYIPPNDYQRALTQAWRQGTIDRPVSRDLSPAEAYGALNQTLGSARDEFLANGGELPGRFDRVPRSYATLDRNGVGSFRIQRPDEKRAKSGSTGETQKEEDPEDTDKTQPDGDEEEFVPEGLAAAKAAGKDALGGCVGTRCPGPAFDDGDDDHDAVSSTKIRTRSRPPKRTRRTESVAIFVSSDPNEILGPAGAGVERWIADAGGLDYGIFFENLGPGSSTIPRPGARRSARDDRRRHDHRRLRRRPHVVLVGHVRVRGGRRTIGLPARRVRPPAGCAGVQR
ncbi:MAG: caspase family protein [Acidimicrobiia bacterium]|nr:caspase family protein [Acidimicrobiia bacterium]